MYQLLRGKIATIICWICSQARANWIRRRANPLATGPPPSFFERSNEEQKSFLSRLIISIIKSSVNCSNNEVQVFLPISMKLVKPLIRSLIESFSIQSIEHLKIMNIIPVGMFVLLSLSLFTSIDALLFDCLAQSERSNLEEDRCQ